MNGQPLVSIVIPFFNAARFMGEAIASVFAQTYGNWELVLVDDGSTDAGTEIGRRHAEEHPDRVHYVEHGIHQNRGACASRNLGIRHTKGEYIAFLDADDVWLPHKLKEQVALMRVQPEAAMVYGTTRYWHSWAGDPEAIRRDYIPNLGIKPGTLIKPPTLLILSLESKIHTPGPSDFLLRRNIIEEVGGFEESFRGVYQLYEDQAFLAKIFLKAPVLVTGECLSQYRLHPDSCVSVANRARQKYKAGLVYLDWLETYLAEHRINNSQIEKALQDKRRRYRLANSQRHYAISSRLLERARYFVGRIRGY